ncbi:hypothetical protein [Ruminiclostridium josui]|nr:hypothetical protein [Ruminiclostridium josui]
MKLHEFLDYQRKLWEMDKKKYQTREVNENNYNNNYNKKANNNTKPSKY